MYKSGVQFQIYSLMEEKVTCYCRGGRQSISTYNYLVQCWEKLAMQLKNLDQTYRFLVSMIHPFACVWLSMN